MKIMKCLLISIILIIILFIIYQNTYNYQNNLNDNVIYIKNYFSNDDFIKVQQLLNNNREDFIYENFRYIKPIYDENILDILYSPNSIDKIQPFINNKIFKSNFPPEYRMYPSHSKGMPWHSDTLLYDKPQYEVIFTLSNGSNSVTEWIDDNNTYIPYRLNQILY